MPITEAEALAALDHLARMRDRVAFEYIVEGCECRSQLFVEELAALGIIAARAWALTVPGAVLRAPDPLKPDRMVQWYNHTAPAVEVSGLPGGVRVLDPAMPGVAGPVTVGEWLAAMRVTAYEELAGPRTQAELLARFAERTMAGRPVQAFAVVVPLGVPPVPDVGGSGFRLEADPPVGVGEFARRQMSEFLDREARMRRGSSRP